MLIGLLTRRQGPELLLRFAAQKPAVLLPTKPQEASSSKQRCTIKFSVKPTLRMVYLYRSSYIDGEVLAENGQIM
jgi:hypothetical protein